MYSVYAGLAVLHHQLCKCREGFLIGGVVLGIAVWCSLTRQIEHKAAPDFLQMFHRLAMPLGELPAWQIQYVST